MIAVVVEIVSSALLLASHDNYHGSYDSLGIFEPLRTVVTRPFRLAASTIHILSASTRFAKRYASRGRKRRPKIYPRYAWHDDTGKGLGHRGELDSASAIKSSGISTVIELPLYDGQKGGAACRTCLQQHAKTGLSRLLRLDQIVEATASHLHASDVRNLGQASRGIRVSLYAHTGIYARSENNMIGALQYVPLQKASLLRAEESLVHTDRAELLSSGTCRYGEKDRCWSCDIQICSTCRHQSRASAADIQHHMDKCTLYCHKCYFREICLKKRSLSRPRRCSHSTGFNGPQAIRSLCRLCFGLTDKSISIRHEGREKRALALLAAQAVRCANCASGLPSGGVRWWVCTLCNLECTDPCHH